MKIRLLCYGSDIENLRMTFEYNVIGVPRKYNFMDNDALYFAIKNKNEWFICGRAKFDQETDLNPFVNPGKYYTYLVKNIEACKPFSINQISRSVLGLYWALIFQNPQYVENKEYIDYVIKNFSSVDKESMFDSLK